MLNIHPTYIPFHPINDKGAEVVAKYMQLFLDNDDPYTYTKMTSKGTTFIGKILAAPDIDTWEKPEYHSKDLQYFTGWYPEKMEVDTAVSRICDPSLTAEIRHFRGATAWKHALEHQIDRLEGELYAVGMKRATCVQWLMAANAKAWIEAKRDEEGHVWVILPWEHVHNTLHVDDLDNGAWTRAFSLKRG